MVKVIWQKGRIAAAHGWFSGIRQVASVCTPPATCFLLLTRVHDPNGISIGSAVFTELNTVTDRQTDRPTDRPRYSVCNSGPHLAYVVLRCGVIMMMIRLLTGIPISRRFQSRYSAVALPWRWPLGSEWCCYRWPVCKTSTPPVCILAHGWSYNSQSQTAVIVAV